MAETNLNDNPLGGRCTVGQHTEEAKGLPHGLERQADNGGRQRPRRHGLDGIHADLVVVHERRVEFRVWISLET